LKDAGFTRATLPEEFGGGGASLSEGFELLSHLAQHDSNLAQILRSHFALVERQILAPPSANRDRVLGRVAAGAVYGNASHERSSASVGSLDTRIRADGDGFLLSGTKYYSTGTLFADWVSVSAVDEQGEFVGVAVDTTSDGVIRVDDWNGFGQRMTGSGTTVFEDVRVPAHDVTYRSAGAPGHGGAYVQLVLLAALNGIGRAIVSDASSFVASRTRVYSNGSGTTAANDPLVLETIGELSALSYQADAALQTAVAALQESHDLQAAGADADDVTEAVIRGDVATAHAQIGVVTSVLDAATKLFDVGGASSTDRARGLDRHWRNARTIATHNPHRNKARLIGDLLVNDSPLSNSWQTGESVV
jgi:alkylation response protein AidB-like acyl-CoA dehydrogenase